MEQLEKLWSLCSHHSDREALMIFIASASYIETADNLSSDNNSSIDDMSQPQSSILSSLQTTETLRSSFSNQVCLSAFQHLFCALDLDWEHLGVGAYQSFQILFKSMCRRNRVLIASNSFALDALWGICLHSGDEGVTSQAMKDLLAVYTSFNTPSLSYSEAMLKKNISSKTMQTPKDLQNSLGRRVFECLAQVENDLRNGKSSSERSAERCLRILNAAVGHDYDSSIGNQSGNFMISLSHINANSNCAEILQPVQHGMRGQLSYRTISVTAKRVSLQQNHMVPNSVNMMPSSSTNHTKATKAPSTECFSLDVHPFETISSIKGKIAMACNHPHHLVKPISVDGRQTFSNSQASVGLGGDTGIINLNANANVFEDSTVAQLGITDGCEVTVILAHNPFPASSSVMGAKMSSKKNGKLNLSDMFAKNSEHGSIDRFFDTLLNVLEALPTKDDKQRSDENSKIDTHNLVWDILLAMPTNQRIVDRVLSATHRLTNDLDHDDAADSDAMVIETPRRDEEWSALINEKSFYRSVYIVQAIDSFLQPASEILSNVPDGLSKPLRKRMAADALSFRTGFIQSGGFEAVLRFFTKDRNISKKKRRTMMGNAVALSVLKCCFFGKNDANLKFDDAFKPSTVVDESGLVMHMTLSDRKDLLKSLTSVVIDNKGVTDSAVLNVIRLLRLLLLSNERMTEMLVNLPNGVAETFFMTLLLWEVKGALTEKRLRRYAKDLILTIPGLSYRALPWLTRALEHISLSSKGTSEFFFVMIKLVETCGNDKARDNGTAKQYKDSARAVCKKLASFQSLADNLEINNSSGVLCGCLELLRALIENGGGTAFKDNYTILTASVNIPSWTNLTIMEPSGGKNLVNMIISPFRGKLRNEDSALINLMGAIFDGFLSSAGKSTSIAICNNKDSRQLGFDVIAAAARSIKGGEGYLALVSRLTSIIAIAVPSLRHKWSHNISALDVHSRSHTTVSKYSGLRNQGCTCYMNSVLQQLFMMPELRKNLCESTIPTCLRSSGSGTMATGADLVGKKISLHWESGVSYDARVQSFDDNTGMHTILYAPLSIGTSGGHPGYIAGNNMGHHQQQIKPEDILRVPEDLPEEFFLSEGRPGRETGVFDILPSNGMDTTVDQSQGLTSGESSKEVCVSSTDSLSKIEETEDEISSRRLLEEVQRTFVHLQECSKGRCFDPRSLVEASGCLKLEFDVWQQNDASEFAMKLLDRLELSLKRWAPKNFKFLEHAFGLKQTKQKICKECNLKVIPQFRKS